MLATYVSDTFCSLGGVSDSDRIKCEMPEKYALRSPEERKRLYTDLLKGLIS